MISLPLVNQRWPLFRLLTRNSWGGTTESGSGWTIQAMERPGPRASGFILLNYNRALLPQLGTAEIMFRFGVFSGQLVGIGSASAARQRSGTSWNTDQDSMAIPDLTGKEIRIQASYPDEDGEATTWRTVWWGNCEYQIDQGWGGSVIPSGDRIYHCVDAFARTRRWFMDRHKYSSPAGNVSPAAGHPGYNVSRLSPSVTAGNKLASEVAGLQFTMPGAGSLWTDKNAIEEALINHCGENQPQWTLVGAVSLFDSSSPWPVSEGETVFGVVTRICSRSRGRGAVLPSWGDDSGSPFGPLTCLLSVFAQISRDIVYQDPAGSQVTVTGAVTRGSAITVDVIGDHRFLPGSLMLGDPEQYRVDYLVTQGEQIEVLATLEHGVSLEPGWDAGEQAAFLSLTPDKRIADRWRPVYQLHRLSRGFSVSLGDGAGGARSSGDYRCKDDGSITTDAQPGSIGNSALDMIETLDDLPLYEGYLYDGGPARADGQAAGAFDGSPVRRPAALYVKNSSADKFIPSDLLNLTAQIKILPDGFLIQCGDDQALGLRNLGDTAQSSLRSQAKYKLVVLTVGLRLPHRVRMASGNAVLGAKRMTITHRDIHLWLAHPGAIWSLDDSAGGISFPAKRFAGGTSPGILRDDRSALARLHALAAAWYMPDQDILGNDIGNHRNASWSLRCCGDIPSSVDYDGGAVIYPRLGQVVAFLSANGQRNELNTTVSSISYDNTSGVTTWTTDWQDLDFK